MRFPLWILAVLIVLSLIFVGFAAYKLFEAQALSPPSAQEAISQAVEVVPPAKQQNMPLIAAPITAPHAAPPTESKSVAGEQSRGHPITDSLSGKEEGVHIVTERVLQKIGSIGVNAGEITQVTLTKS